MTFNEFRKEVPIKSSIMETSIKKPGFGESFHTDKFAISQVNHGHLMESEQINPILINKSNFNSEYNK